MTTCGICIRRNNSTFLVLYFFSVVYLVVDLLISVSALECQDIETALYDHMYECNKVFNISIHHIAI